jgi:hypothetical protein
MGAGWRGIRTAEAQGVQTYPTTKGGGAAEEIDTYFHTDLLLLPRKHHSIQEGYRQKMRENSKISSVSDNGCSGVFARSRS